MAFKIVQTIENSKLCLAIIPGNWEEEGTLWWPNQKLQLGSLLKNQYSLPDRKKWEKIPCVMKRKCMTYKDAEKELKFMEDNSDTEADGNILRLKTQTRKHKLHQKQSVVSMPDFDEDLSMILNSNMVNITEAQVDEEGSIVFPAVGADTSEAQVNEQGSIVYPAVGAETFLTSSQLENIEVEAIVEDCVENNTKNEVINMLNDLLSNQEKIMYGIANIKTEIDAVGRIIGKLNLNKEKEIEVKENQPFIKPVKSLQELEELENTLKNEDYMNQIIKTMTFICGSSGKQNGLDCCYKLIDFFLDRKFVTQCSWTGNSRAGQSVTKVPLKFYEKFRMCFLKLIIKADNEFGETDCDSFFKRVMKNSQQRKSAKGCLESKHKCRPKNLKYKKHVTVLSEENVVEVIEGNEFVCPNDPKTGNENYSDNDSD